MKILFYVATFLLLLSGCFNDLDSNNKQLNALYDDADQQANLLLEGAERIEFLYQQQRGGVQVNSIGRITKLFENQQSPYVAQLILIRLNTGRKLLIKHNIEKASALPSLTVGEMLAFSGIYNWNSKGGVVQSTHQQADKAQRSGWLEYQQVTYQ